MMWFIYALDFPIRRKVYIAFPRKKERKKIEVRDKLARICCKRHLPLDKRIAPNHLILVIIIGWDDIVTLKVTSF